MVSLYVASLIGRLQGATDVIKLYEKSRPGDFGTIPNTEASKQLFDVLRELREAVDGLTPEDAADVASTLEAVLDGLNFHREEVLDLLREVMEHHQL